MPIGTGGGTNTSSQNNVITNNIIDLGNSSMYITACPFGSNHTFHSNIIISNFVGALNTQSSTSSGFAFFEDSSTLTITNNVYWNYATNGSIFSNGQQVSDSNPINENPLVTGNNITYTVTAGSPVFNSPVNFQQIVGGWGPPGFVIPAGVTPSYVGGGSAFYVATNGSDSNPGTFAQPFLTLTKAQTAMQGSTIKTTNVRAGTYTIGATINFGSSDLGETFQYYSPDGVNTAILDGGNSTATCFSFSGTGTSGASAITINGLKIQRFTTYGIAAGDQTGADVHVTNCELANIGTPVVENVAASNAVFGNSQRWIVSNCYLHDIPVAGITFWAFNAGDSCDGCIAQNNVLLRCTTGEADSAALYVNMHASNETGGHVTLQNNYVKDSGSAGTLTLGVYLDDDSSNVTISGNIIGPMVSGVGNQSTSCQQNGGSRNLWINNIIDVGTNNNVSIMYDGPAGTGGSLMYTPTNTPTGSNQFKQNIFIAKYAGACAVVGFRESGHNYDQDPALTTAWLSPLTNNMYHNYGGGAEDTTGNVFSDSNPIHANPLVTGNGVTYTIGAGSPAFNNPVNFQQIVGGWGPPGFVIPAGGMSPSYV